ncbi:MAG: zinc ribbon domain-containing protein [Dehalococcoidia bacterium]|nr:zinc ribbon domain-containing protein [Dehalococcoidia bacterium]
MVDRALELLTCPECAEPYEATDNYCRHCGMFLRDHRLPVARQTVALEPRRPALPTPVRRAATAIAVGTALKITANILGKVLAQRAANKASSRALARKERETTVVSESLFVRRTWIERD